MNEITKNLMAISMRNGVVIWAEKNTIENIMAGIAATGGNKFFKLPTGQIINTADLVGIFSPQDMEEVIRKKRGEYKCDFNNWHKLKEECECAEIHFTSAQRAVEKIISECEKCTGYFIKRADKPLIQPCQECNEKIKKVNEKLKEKGLGFSFRTIESMNDKNIL